MRDSSLTSEGVGTIAAFATVADAAVSVDGAGRRFPRRPSPRQRCEWRYEEDVAALEFVDKNKYIQ